jgi:acetyl esterase/lipase
MKFEKIMLSEDSDKVFLDVYVADKIGGKKRKPLLVIPGGGYGSVCSDREGEPIAMAFMPYGYNTFVLHYTVGRKKPFPCQLIEAAKAIKHIKDNAEEYNIDPDELFVVGFSAGGHLAASTGVLWKNEEIYKSVDMPYGYNKPKGVILAYPVVSPKFKNHITSFRNLWCTDTPTDEQLQAAAIEEHVDCDSAPAFIMHTTNDQTVDVGNALVLANAYATAKIPFELHIYPDGPHGMALANSITDCNDPKYNDPAIAEWVRHAVVWAETQCK